MEAWVYVGIDWGPAVHHIWASDAQGSLIGERQVANHGGAVTELVTWLVERAHGQPAHVCVALEMPRGALVDVLLERGCQVFSINPKQLDRFRDRYAPSGAKDDRRDAQALATALRTDPAAFRPLRIDDPVIVQLREYSRQDAELGEDRVRLTNRLRDLVLRVWPEALTLCPAADEPWFWSLLERVPTPAVARTVRPARIHQILRSHRIRRLSALAILTCLRQPATYVAPGVREGVVVRLLDVIAQLRVVDRQRHAAERRLATMLESLAGETEPEQTRERHDATILQSLPGIGTRIAATMLAEAADALRRRDYHALRALTGVAPITKQSGRSRLVQMRRTCHLRLRTAVHLWAQGSIRDDAHARAHYRQLRARGHSHPRALRGLADRQLRVLIALLQQNTLYDPNHRRGALVA